MNEALLLELGERAYRDLTVEPPWQAWAVGLSRCGMCLNMSCADWRAMCDCFWHWGQDC